jgi:hypothetical protein
VNLMSIALLLAGACQTSVATLGTAATNSIQSDEPVARVYDLGTLVLRSSEEGISERGFPIVSEEVNQTEFNVNEDEDFILSVMRILLAADFESEEVRIDAPGGRRLWVRAPRAVHDRIAAALLEFEGLFASRVQIEVSFVRMVDATRVNAGLVPDAEAVALLDTAGRSGRLERMRLEVGPGLPAVLDVGQESALVADFDVEVAEGAYTFDPKVWPILLGTRLSLRAAPARQGLILALSMRRGTAVGEIVEREFRRAGAIVAGDAARIQTPAVVHESQTVLTRSVALNALLPDGQALVALLGHTRAEVREALIVRKVGGGLPISRPLSAGPGARPLTVLDCTRFAPPVSVSDLRETLSSRPYLLPHPSHLTWTCNLTTQPWDERSNGGGEIDALLELQGIELDQSEGYWPLRALTVSEQQGKLDLLAHLAAGEAEQRGVLVELSLRRAAGNAIIAGLSLPLRAGLESTAILASEDLLLHDFDVELAKLASVEDPVMRSLYEGLLLTLEPRFTPGGDVCLKLFGAGVAPDGARRSLEPSGRNMGQIEGQGQRYLFLDSELRFPAGGGATTQQLGDSAGGLVLDVSLRIL